MNTKVFISEINKSVNLFDTASQQIIDSIKDYLQTKEKIELDGDIVNISDANIIHRGDVYLFLDEDGKPSIYDDGVTLRLEECGNGIIAEIVAELDNIQDKL